MRYETHGSLEDTKQWLREEEKQLDSDLLYDFGFHKKDSDELIGSGGLTFNQQQGIWELGCNLRRDCWNQGYGTEAAAAILSFAENTLHIHRVMARRAKENTASGRVLEKNGFSFVRECWDQKWSGSHRPGMAHAGVRGDKALYGGIYSRRYAAEDSGYRRRSGQIFHFSGAEGT